MAFAKARTALADLEEKLRRQLRLAGEIAASFTPNLTPVIIAGDLRDAGNASNVGRAWGFGFQGAPIANDVFSMRFEQDVFIDFIILSNSGASTNVVGWITVPGQAPAIGVVNLAGTWTDRKLIIGDKPPITIPAGWGAVTGTPADLSNRFLTTSLGSNLAGMMFPQNMMLPAGSHLNFSSTANTGVHLNVRGRIWP